MRIYLQPPQPSRGLQRIADALTRYAPPSVTVVPTQAQAELVVIYAIGRRDALERQCEAIVRSGRRYAIIQVCLKSTMSPSVDSWADIWEGAATVWSYYDLAREWDRAGYDADGGWKFPQHFYHAPLGADASVFYPLAVNKQFIIATSGQNRLQESIRECALAAEAAGGWVFHLGPSMRHRHWNVVSQSDISDEYLASEYNRCHFVSGLRRTEGFELPAVEGLLCGARPLVFDNSDWRWNYGEHAEYLHEGTRQEVVDQLVQLFQRGARPVTADERQRAVARYDWKSIIGGFYERLST